MLGYAQGGLDLTLVPTHHHTQHTRLAGWLAGYAEGKLEGAGGGRVPHDARRAGTKLLCMHWGIAWVHPTQTQPPHTTCCAVVMGRAMHMMSGQRESGCGVQE